MDRHDEQLLHLFRTFGGDREGIPPDKMIALADQLHLGDRLLQLLPGEPTFAHFSEALGALLDEQRADALSAEPEVASPVLESEPETKTVRKDNCEERRKSLRRSVSLGGADVGVGRKEYREVATGADPLPEVVRSEEEVVAADSALAAATREIRGLEERLAMAERRAALLARDVDESQAALVAASETAVRKAEERLADQERKHRTLLAKERERLNETEAALGTLEAERARLKTKLAEVEAERAKRAAEAKAAKEEARELAEVRKRLSAEVRRLAEERDARVGEEDALREARDAAESEAARLRRENDALRRSNGALRDRIDELESEMAEAREYRRCASAVGSAPGSPPRGVELAKELNLDATDAISLLAERDPVEEDGGTPEKISLERKCSELEASLELLRNEYEKCEEYWSLKLEEERDIFEGEQRISDEKFSELSAKIAEYEEQFATREDRKGRLSTIEERSDFEKQFADLEGEYEAYRRRSEESLRSKDEELKSLRDRIERFSAPERSSTGNANEIVGAQTKSSPTTTTQTKGGCRDVPDAAVRDFDSPIGYLWNQSAIPSPLIRNGNVANAKREGRNPVFDGDRKFDDGDHKFDDANSNGAKIGPIRKPESTGSEPETKAIVDAETESKPFAKIIRCSELEEVLQGRRAERLRTSKTSQQMVITNLEMKCMQLQCALRQQQIYNESLMRQTLVNHKSEIGALLQQLAAVDLLVRDLYVENCHLTSELANVAP